MQEELKTELQQLTQAGFFKLFKSLLNVPFTVEPRFNEPRFNEDPVITNNIWKPGRISVKYMETNPAITKSLL